MDIFNPYVIALVAAGLYMAWNIGANDLANAMGTSVGSGALSLKQVILIAAVFEFLGAVFFGKFQEEINTSATKQFFLLEYLSGPHHPSSFHWTARKRAQAGTHQMVHNSSGRHAGQGSVA